jgi:long-chain acyl-CoA synthetase
MALKSNNNLRALLENRAREQGEKTFLFSESDGRRWTYAEFDKAVNRFANFLLRHGIEKGDVVSLLMPNSAEYIIAYFGCWKIGALAGPVNSLLKAEEIAFVINHSEARMLLFNSQFQATIEILHRKLPSLDSIFMFDDAALETTGFANELPPENSLKPDDEAIIIYTSGTTGKPKGCLLTHGNLIANARQITGWLGFDERDRLLTIMPLFHMNAVSVTTMTALYAGASTVVSTKFSASRFWQIVADYKITSFGSVATMLSMLLQKESEAGSRKSESNPKSKIQNPKSETLRFAMCGSAPVPAEVLRKFEEAFACLVVEGYGLSESTCRSTFNPPNTKRRPGSCGQPIGNEMKVFDENDAEVPPGSLGEIVLRGENIFKGYFKNEAATRKAFAGGWFHTGDIGYRDDDGFFYIADRKSDLIIRGGENIYPREIDELLYTHPAVESAAVIGVPDELYGEAVAAFVVLKDDSRASENDLINFCKEHLAD